MAIPNRLALLNDDGTTDTSFALTYGLNAAGKTVQVDKDGQIIVGGQFTQIDDEVRLYLAAVAQDGTISPNTGNTNGFVQTLIGQTDGKTLVAGEFTAIGGVNRGRMCRVDGSLNVEEAYTPSFNGPVYALAQQEDGKTLAGGLFSTVSTVSRANLVRLYNNEAPTSLTVENVDLIQWLRGGASQEVQNVSFEEPAGTPIAGTVTRINGGWQFVPDVSLTGSGTITARAFPTDSHSEGILEDTVAYDVNPEIQVSVDGVILVDNVSTVDYADTQVGATLSKVFTITNIGLADLNLTSGPNYVALSGANANQWAIVAQPASPIEPGDSVTFVLNFTPTSEGAKVATLTINSDDADEGTFTVSLTGDAIPGPGGIDATWQPVANGFVYALGIDRTELIWPVGAYTTINGLNRGRYARLNLSGTVQSQTGTGATPNEILAVCHLPDGKCYIGGTFTSVNGVARTRLARLNNDGTLDASFNLAANGSVNCFALQADGAVVVGGGFTTFGGNSRFGLARINSSGAFDTTFVPGLNSTPQSLCIQTDGKILVGGLMSYFLPSGGSAKQGIVRLNTDGSIDETFVSTLNGSVASLTLNTSDEIIVGGTYTMIGVTSRKGVNRLTSAGALDTDFAENQTYGVSLALQCDSKLLIGAYTAGSVAATERLTRVDSVGVNDSTFVATARNFVAGLTIQEDGKILVGGIFTLSGSATKYASRLINDASGASSTLSVVSPTQVQWLRTGTAPETQIVNFSFSQDGGSTWTSLGQADRITNGWDLSGVTLPISGILRGQAFIQCGYGNGSVTIHEDQVSFSNLAVGDLNVEYPVGTTIANDGTLNFAGTLPGQFLDYTVTLRNTGNASITGISATIPVSDWTIISAPLATLAPNQTTTCTIRFSPSAVGARPSAYLSIVSSLVGAKNPYSILLTGNGVAVPLATTTNSTSPGSGQRTFNGTFRANHDTANAYFQYKLASSGVWLDTSPPQAISGFVNVNLSKTVSGLTVGQSYNWRAIIYNAVNAGQAPAAPFTGSIGTFTAT